MPYAATDLNGRATQSLLIYNSMAFQSSGYQISMSINIATLGTPNGAPLTRSLADHLTALLTSLTASSAAGDVMIGIQASYRYRLAPDHDLTTVLPVLLLTPRNVAVGPEGTSPISLVQLIGSLRDGIEAWGRESGIEMVPSTRQPALKFDITFDQAQQQAPVLRSTELVLPLIHIAPPLWAKGPRVHLGAST